MTDLIQQAEALEAQARTKDTLAAMNRADATDFRAEAAKLREQAAREPLRCWVNIYDNHEYIYRNEDSAAKNAHGNINVRRIAVPMVEVRPVRITPEHEQQAWQIFNDTYGFGAKPWRSVMEYALSLAGVEVEK